MNICLLMSDLSWNGGTAKMASLLANALGKTGEIFLLSLHQEFESVLFPLDDFIRYKTLNPAKSKLGMLAQISEIRNFLRANRIDRVINVDTGMGLYGILGARGTGAKVITWEHANYFNNWDSRLFPHLRRFAARHSDAIVVLTEQDKQNYQTHIPHCAPVHVIPNPAEMRPFTYKIDSRTILSAGLLSPIKRYDRVVELAARLLPSRPEWQWVICGEGPEREALEHAIKAAGLAGRILLPGTVRDMDTQYRSAALFVMTSDMEGLPMVLLEAKSHGLPLVSFDIETGPRDIITNSVNGSLVQPYDLTAMEEKIAVLMDSEDLRRQYSEHSQLGMEKFAWEGILDAWHTLLERM